VTLASKVALITGVHLGSVVPWPWRWPRRRSRGIYVSVNAAGAQALVDELSARTAVAAFQGNVDSEADVARFIDGAVSRLGRLDILEQRRDHDALALPCA
jgi:NAD(P)-dependent dehydrogenase (short-subunit alcohol dehydrogenase family)